MELTVTKGQPVSNWWWTQCVFVLRSWSVIGFYRAGWEPWDTISKHSRWWCHTLGHSESWNPMETQGLFLKDGWQDSNFLPWSVTNQKNPCGCDLDLHFQIYLKRKGENNHSTYRKHIQSECTLQKRQYWRSGRLNSAANFLQSFSHWEGLLVSMEHPWTQVIFLYD